MFSDGACDGGVGLAGCEEGNGGELGGGELSGEEGVEVGGVEIGVGGGGSVGVWVRWRSGTFCYIWVRGGGVGFGV